MSARGCKSVINQNEQELLAAIKITYLYRLKSIRTTCSHQNHLLA